MNRLKLFLVIIICISFFSSCNKENTDVQEEIKVSNYSNVISEQRVQLGKALVKAFTENTEMRKLAIDECYKLFDGDRDVLCKDLFDKQVGSLKSTSNSFGKLLNEYAINSNSLLKSTSSEDFSQSIVCNDSLVQLYFFRSESTSDSVSFGGIVVLPYPFKEKTDLEVLLIKNDGTETTIRTDVDPDKNYLVISQNERSRILWSNNEEQSSLKSVKSAMDEPNYSVGKAMTITNACFTSLNAKRTIEPWVSGEPEVRVNVMYAIKDHLSNTMEAKNCTFYYPKNWIKTDGFNNYIKYVNTPVQCPYWYRYEHSYERRIRWTEEDGTTKETEINQEFTDPTTKIKTSSTIKIPASTDETIFADSYIDYMNPEAGEQNWGVIKFILEF